MIKKILLSFVATISLFSAERTVVFDFGGVMTTKSNREAVIEFLRSSFYLSQEEFEKINQDKKQAIKSGKTDEEFWLEFAKQRNINLPDTWTRDFKFALKEAIGPDAEMYQLVDQLKEKNIPVALLSNIDHRYALLIREFGLYDPFEPCLLSCETGTHKPDPKAYLVLLDTLKRPAQEVVFIDDKLENVEAAKKLGIDAILFESPEQLHQELKQRNLL